MNIKTPVVNVIVAMASNRVIGNKNELPWDLPEDLKRFKKLTMGHPVFMGRRTYDSIGKALPGRDNFIISRNSNLKITDAAVISSFEQGLSLCFGKDQVFIIGGQQIYEATLPMTDRIYLTTIKKCVVGDTFFPQLDESLWEIKREPVMISQKLKIKYQFQTFSKVKPTETLQVETENH